LPVAAFGLGGDENMKGVKVKSFETLVTDVYRVAGKLTYITSFDVTFRNLYSTGMGNGRSRILLYRN
jgi:hypothetical protein